MEENKKAMAQAILLLSEQKVTQAEPILKELAANGDVEAKFTLAGLYLSGGNGSPLAIYLLSSIEMSNVFADAEYGEKSVSLNFDDEGDDEETLTFSREEGGYYHGLKMTLQSVSFASGESMSIDITADKFQILKESTNNMPDIIGDNYLYRWDGSRYEEYMWDGTNLVKTI